MLGGVSISTTTSLALLPARRSHCAAPTVTRLVKVAGASGTLWMTTVADPPLARTPRLQTISPPWVAAVPCEGVTETMFSAGLTALVSQRFVAKAGPRFVTRQVTTKLLATPTGLEIGRAS